MSEAEGTYTPAQAAKILRLSEQRIIQLITDGDLAGVMDEGGHWRIPRRAVHDRLGNRLAIKQPRTHQVAPMTREADFYTPGEVARLLGLTEYTVLGLLTTGQLEGRQDEQARWWIPASTIEDAVRHSRGTDSQPVPSAEETIPMPSVGSETQASEETIQFEAVAEPARRTEPSDARRTMPADVRGQVSESGWTTTDKAARALGVSPRTVRRFIDRGELEGRKVTEGIVEAWEVSIDSLYALRDKRKSEEQVRRIDPRKSTESQGAVDTTDYIRDLTDRLLRLSSEAAELRTR